MITDAKLHLEAAREIVRGMFKTPGAPMMLPPKQLMDLPALQHYFAYFLQKSDQELEAALHIHEPVGGYLSNVVRDTEADDKLFPSYRIQFEDGLRQSGSHSLSEEEFQQAAQVMMSDRNLLHSFALIKLGMKSYLQDTLYQSDIYMDGRYEMIDRAVDTMSKAPFVEELLPTMAYGYGLGMASGSDFSKGLAHAFRMKTFTSIDRLSKGTPAAAEPKIAQCPFRQIVGHLFNTDLQAVDGGLAIAAQPSPGALPAMIYQRMQQVFPPQAAFESQPAPIRAVG